MKQESIQVLEKVQLKASQILRHTKIEQCFGTYNLGKKYCALGVLANHFGWKGFDSNEGYLEFGSKTNDLIGADIACELFHKNDQGMSFAQLADWLEEKGL